MREKRISRLLTDDYSERILAACFHQARAAQEISDAFDIPIAACYRKIHELEEAGFLACEKEVVTAKGKSMRLYRSQLRRAQIVFEEGAFRVQFVFEPEQEINGKWIDLSKSA